MLNINKWSNLKLCINDLVLDHTQRLCCRQACIRIESEDERYIVNRKTLSVFLPSSTKSRLQATDVKLSLLEETFTKCVFNEKQESKRTGHKDKMSKEDNPERREEGRELDERKLQNSSFFLSVLFLNEVVN